MKRAISLIFVSLVIPVGANSHGRAVPLPLALKVKDEVQASPQFDLSRALAESLTGWTSISEEEQKRLKEQAQLYVRSRRGLRFQFEETCAQATDANVFCHLEKLRQDRRSRKASASKKSKEPRHQAAYVVRDLRNKDFARLEQYSGGMLNKGLAKLKGYSQIEPIGRVLVENKECVSPHVISAIGGKTEEFLPDAEALKLALSLYQKSATCGSDPAALRARYRWGLMTIASGSCDGINEWMQPIEASPEVSFFHSRSKYWRYYCARRLGQGDLEKQLQAEITKDYPLSIHALALVGSEELAKKLQSPEKPVQVQFRSFLRSDLNGLAEGVEALEQLGEQNIAADLIETHLDELKKSEPEFQMYFGVILNRMEMGLTKFRLLSNLFQDNPKMIDGTSLKLYFPLWKYDIVKTTVDTTMDPLLILSIVRQESAFNEKARSRVGAVGLMQVMPKTARWISSTRGKKLWNPQTNVQVGTKYFMHRLKQLDGEVEMTLAAYNAGILRVEEWRERYPIDNRLLFVDLMPYRETREYVATILRNYYWYVRLYSEEPLEARVQKVALKPSGALKVGALSYWSPEEKAVETPQ